MFEQLTAFSIFCMGYNKGAIKRPSKMRFNMSDYILKFEEAEAAYLSQRAKERGYSSLEDYLRALVAADALIEILREDWNDADESVHEIETSFREAWHDAMTGRTHPIEILWNSDDDEGT
jgi:hypothetical protein